MANYNREKKAFAGAFYPGSFGGSLPAISGSTPAQPDYSGGWLGKMMGMSGPSAGATTQGMLLDRQNGTDTASRQKAIQAAMPSKLPAPTQPDYSGGWLGKMMGMSGPSTGATTQGMQLDRQNGTDTMSRRNAQMQAGTNVGGGAPIGTMGEAAGTNAGGGLPEGVKQSMDKQAIAQLLKALSQGGSKTLDALSHGGNSLKTKFQQLLGKDKFKGMEPSRFHSGLPVGRVAEDELELLAGMPHQPLYRGVESTHGKIGYSPKGKPKDMAGLATYRPNPGHYRNVITGEQNAMGPLDPYGLGLKNPTMAEQIKNLITGNSKTAMSKRAAFHANRLHILNTEIARYTPAVLLKQAAEYPTTRNKQACAYYLGLKKQAAVEKKAFLKLLGKGLMGAGGLIGSAYNAARPALGQAAENAVRGVRIATKKAPIASLAGGSGLVLAGEHYGLPFLGDVANTVKDRYNESAKGFDEFMHRLGRGYKATTADPTSDFASDGINKAKKVIESVTPKAVTNSGIIPSKPSRYLEVEEGSIPSEYKSRSLPRDNPQWRSGTRGRDYPRY